MCDKGGTLRIKSFDVIIVRAVVSHRPLTLLSHRFRSTAKNKMALPPEVEVQLLKLLKDDEEADHFKNYVCKLSNW